MEQHELSSIAGGNAKWYIHFGREFLKKKKKKEEEEEERKEKLAYRMIQQSYSWVHKGVENLYSHKNLHIDVKTSLFIELSIY